MARSKVIPRALIDLVNGDRELERFFREIGTTVIPSAFTLEDIAQLISVVNKAYTKIESQNKTIEELQRLLLRKDASLEPIKMRLDELEKKVSTPDARLEPITAKLKDLERLSCL